MELYGVAYLMYIYIYIVHYEVRIRYKVIQSHGESLQDRL